jgi:hypothetical protein
MTSAEIKRMYENDEVDKLYKNCVKYFDLIDQWADRLIDGDLLDENELKYAQQQMNGCQTKLNPIAGAFEALLVEYENNYIVEEENKIEKIRIQDQNHCKALARKKSSDIRRYASDFSRYVQSAQNTVVTIQSLLKRLAVEKSNKEVGFTGETIKAEEQQNKGW